MSWSDEVLSGLSAEAMKALREFAAQSGIQLESGVDYEESTSVDLVSSLHNHFRPPTDRETIFDIAYETSENIVPKQRIQFQVKGVKKELGQTLDSTGLTM
jgi:hypothetical protein